MFVNRTAAENTPGWKNWAVINISDPHSALGESRLMSGWYAALRWEFHDIDPENPDDEIDGFLLGMSEEQALEIVRFVREVAQQVQGIMVHCNSGASRSAEVAK